MLDSIYHMTWRLPWILISAVKTSYFCHYVRKSCYGLDSPFEILEPRNVEYNEVFLLICDEDVL